MSGKILPGIVVVIVAAVVLQLHFSTKALPQDDYYHIKAGAMFPETGIQKEFPWLRHTVFAKNNYDMHFLFHVMTAPFARGDLAQSAKLVATACLVIVLVSAWLFLAWFKVPLAPLWAVLAVGASAPILLRMMSLRPLGLSVALLFLVIVLLLREKHLLLLPLMYFLVLFYSGFPVPLSVVGLYVLTASLAAKRLIWKPLLYAGLGVAAGLVLNPFFPDNLEVLYIQIVKIGQNRPAADINAEWAAPGLLRFAGYAWPALLVLAAGVVAYLKRVGRPDGPHLFLVSLALFFLALALRYMRGMDFFIPFGVAAGAILLHRAGVLSGRLVRVLAGAAIAGVFALGASGAHRSLALIDRYDNSGAALWLQANTPAGSTVFLANYGAFPQLFFYNTHNTYSHGFDNVFLREHDPRLYAAYREILAGKNDPHARIKQEFGCRYLHLENLRPFRHLYAYIDAHPRLFTLCYRDRFAAVYRLE